MIDLIFPEAGLSAMRLLRREGLKVIYPQDQTCCGQPAFNSDYHDEARRVACAQLNAFPQDLPIIVPSRSADIEQTLAYGVHGPKELIVLVQNWTELSF